MTLLTEKEWCVAAPEAAVSFVFMDPGGHLFQLLQRRGNPARIQRGDVY